MQLDIVKVKNAPLRKLVFKCKFSLIQKLKHTIAKPFCFWKLNWKISFELSVTRHRFEGSRYAVLAEYKIFLSMNHSSYMFLLFKSSNTFSNKYLQQREYKENCKWKSFLTLITKDAVAQIQVCVWLHEMAEC